MLSKFFSIPISWRVQMRMIASGLTSLAYLTILAVAHAAGGKVSVLPPQNLDALRPMLFADTPLPELAKLDSASESWRTFRKAFEALKANDSKAARGELKKIITNPETRFSCWPGMPSAV